MKRLVLSLFPGIGLFDRAFEDAGFQIVRGPDHLWGGDVRKFHVPPVFNGVIGGPPCQLFSRGRNPKTAKTPRVDLIPEFVRVCREADPQWVVMENVSGAKNSPAIPRDWHPAIVRDFEAGGLTMRKRFFWTWPFSLFDTAPSGRQGSLSVLASSGKRVKGKAGYLCGITVKRAAELQGFPELAERLSSVFSKEGAIHVLGNGVPRAMGNFIASQVVRCLGHDEQGGAK